jgi:hypothetical protein
MASPDNVAPKLGPGRLESLVTSVFAALRRRRLAADRLAVLLTSSDLALSAAFAPTARTLGDLLALDFDDPTLTWRRDHLVIAIFERLINAAKPALVVKVIARPCSVCGEHPDTAIQIGNFRFCPDCLAGSEATDQASETWIIRRRTMRSGKKIGQTWITGADQI